MKSKSKRANHQEFWTDPAKGWNDDANKKQAHYQSRISRDTEKEVIEFLEATGMQKNHFTDQALMNFIAQHHCIGEDFSKSADKRGYRKDPALLPNPELAPQASANRNKKPANLRLYEEFLKQVDDAAKEASMTRTSWIEEAIQEKLTSQKSQECNYS